MDLSDLQQLLQAIAGARVVAVGDVMVDRFTYGEVSRISPEAPIPVMTHAHETVMLGAAGNVARNAAVIGAQVALVGVIGRDGAGSEAKTLVGEAPGIEGYLITDADRPTTVKTRFVSAGQQLLRLDQETTAPIAGEVEQQLVRTLLDAARGAAAILVSDYGKGVVTAAVVEAALAAGAPLEEAIDFANLAAGVAVQKVGTATASPDELMEAEITERLAPAEAKIATADRMAREAARWRERGLKVGFTNGCFDILHRGHIAYLAQARGWCDRLIVGLNSDRSVRALKGEGRPVNDLQSRALVLAGLGSVDLVTPFDEETPLKLIEAARPDVLIKGSDYSVDGVVGHELVEGWGGEVRLADFIEGQSTTATIARLAKRA